ncbi:Protein FAR1-RELATED SEQUENCE 6 [Glycine max]|nr:Protein FAR1-RELATED SEQUENCE 6 [Glycine max]KAH1208848.1 Protein FAR1-RELATED SEQUENCE 6 [Glycine max]KAH1208849.1 Protein FAR1-RELATED SEQUENCE 6 [Glycine max]KAH1208850.1 Protein FAR1-RELATED SEQUENCE 6 [Glycine max]
MTDDVMCSPNDKDLSLSPNLDITIDDGSPNNEQLLEVEDEGNELENECGQLFEIDGSEPENGRDETTIVDSHSGESQGKDCPPPVVRMEFDTYDDAYNYYNTYAKDIGFAIRVKSSWTKRNSKEKRGAVLCCNCEGFKTTKEANMYSKDTFFAGISDYEKGESVIPFFKGHVHQQTSLKEFFEIYELVQQKKHKTEVLDDFESRDLSSLLKTRCYYELQLSKLYTNAVFRKFQDEVVMMSSCFSITQTQTSGSIVTYMVKEREGEEPARDARNFEVMYDNAGAEVRCICSCFNFKGYLCRHALYILNYNCVEEISCQYILSRWRRDFKRLYVPHLSADNVDISNPVQCFDHLYKRAMQVVEEGMISQDHYMLSWQTFKESLNKIRLVADKIE